MSFHDSLAEAALRDGNAPHQFRDAAKRHANASVLLAVAGVALWFLLGWGWSVVPFALATLTALQSVSATMTGRKLEPLMPYGATASSAASLPAQIDLNNVLHVTIVDDVRQRYSALLVDESHPYAGCMFRPASTLPYSKATIKRALESLLDFAEGRRDSRFLANALRTPENAETLRKSVLCLEFFLEVPAADLPTDPSDNAIAGSQLSDT